MKRNKRTGEKMFDSASEVHNFMKIDGEKDFKQHLAEMNKPENVPITNLTQFDRHMCIVQALNRTPDKPDINKMYKFVIYSISQMMLEDKTIHEAYAILSNVLHVTVDKVKHIEKEAIKVIVAANKGDFFKGVISL